MGLLFNRSVRVAFGLPDEPFTLVRGLFIQFEVEKTSEKNANRINIRVYNTNETSRATLEQENVIVKLDAGYAGSINEAESIDELFIGNITKASSEKTGNEWITTIEAGDGSKKFKESQVNTTLGPGANNKQVIETLAKSLEVGIGTIKGVVEDVFQNGITLTGPVDQRMDEITEKMGLEWSIQDDKLMVLPPNEPSENIGMLISPATGLIGAPINREKGIEFRSLLRGSIKPGVAIQLQSRDFNGIFKIRKAVFSGDNRKGPFEVRCDAILVPSGAVEVSQLLNVGVIA